jgi:hypothetical protein
LLFLFFVFLASPCHTCCCSSLHACCCFSSWFCYPEF